MVNQLNGNFEIVEGYEIDTSIHFEVSGLLSGVGQINSQGTFDALAEAPNLGDCFIVATKGGVADTLDIIINPEIITPVICTPNPDNIVQMSHDPSSNIIGVSATLNTKFGKLCDANVNTLTKSTAWIGLQNDDTVFNYTDNKYENKTWANMGYVRISPDGVNIIYNTYFVEFNAHYGIRQIFHTATPLAIGSQHEFKIELNDSLARWEYYLDGNMEMYYYDDSSYLYTAQYPRSIYGGENAYTEDDMPGTLADPNIFSNCKIRKNNMSLYESTNFDLSNIGYFRPFQSQWMILYIDSNTVHSWDVNPQP